MILRNSIVHKCNSGIEIGGSNYYDSHIERNIFKDSASLYYSSNSDKTINISNNVFIDPISIGQDWHKCAICVEAPYNIVIEKNSFITNNKIAIKMNGSYYGDIVNNHLNATNNYWGTTDENVIKNMIYDRNDSLDCKAYVDYAPFLTAPDPDTPVLNQ